MPIGRRSPEVEACCFNQILRGRNCGTTLFWHLSFCAGKLSDVMYVPPWRIATGGNKGKSPLDRFTYKVFEDAD